MCAFVTLNKKITYLLTTQRRTVAIMSIRSQPPDRQTDRQTSIRIARNEAAYGRGLGDRDAGAVLCSESGHGDLSLVGPLLRLLELLLCLAVLGQVHRGQLLLQHNTSRSC